MEALAERIFRELALRYPLSQTEANLIFPGATLRGWPRTVFGRRVVSKGEAVGHPNPEAGRIRPDRIMVGKEEEYYEPPMFDGYVVVDIDFGPLVGGSWSVF